MLQALIPSALLLITPFDTSLFTDRSCLTDNFYGTYAGQSVFNLESSCFEGVIPGLDSGSIVPSFQPFQQLVWVQEEAVDESLWDREASLVDPLDELLERLSASDPFPADGGGISEGQQLLAQPDSDKEYAVLYRTPSAALLSVRPDVARTIDTIVPRFYRSTLLPSAPSAYIPVPSPAVGRIKELLASLKFDPVVAAIVNTISTAQMRRDIRYLTGEDNESPIVSRHSFAAGSRTAAAWLKLHFEKTGAVCELRDFLVGFAPNVICRYPSTVVTNATVLLSAHYDSRGSFGSSRAPGGDDDGSGVIALLGIAQAIADTGLTFRSNVELVAFAGEEQGLLGSKAYARELHAAGANLTVMMQADMLAYRAPNEPPQLGLPDLIGTPEVAQLVANISSIYSPELKVGFTPACCSDHQSFHEQGFAATHIFERAGPIVDPMYHNSGDISDRENYDFDQVKSIAKVEFATLLHAAGFDLPE